MRIVKIVFSPAGGTQKAVDLVADALEGEQIELDLTDSRERYLSEMIRPDDLVLIAMPVYGGRAPVLAMERFRKLTGNKSRCFLMAVYGNRDYEDTLAEMSDAAEECGFIVTGAAAVIAEHSVVRQYAAGRPDEADRAVLQRTAQQLLRVIENGSFSGNIPGNRPYTKPMSLSLVPKLSKGCISCGKCRENCPAGAIDRNFTADPGKCISCMRCIGICPASARRPSAVMVKMSSMVLKKGCSRRKKIGIYL